MTIDVNELHYGFTDMKPIDMDWSEGWTETWEFTDADEVEVPVAELTELTCSYCEEPVAFIHGVLTHTEVTCLHCAEPITEDDNGAGGKVWVHDFGSTVCYDDPPGSHEDGDTTTVAEPDYDKGHDAELELEDTVRFLSADGETGLALTGGGMDLSWEICMAYMVLGYLPPLHYADLPDMAGKRATADNLAIIAACKRAVEAVKEQADRTIRRLSETESYLTPEEAS